MRDYRKDKRNDKQGSKRPDRGSDRFNRSSGGFNRRSGRRDEKMMHQVICDGCGKECEVPFKPTAGKPVYCSNCFKSKGKNSKPSQYDCKQDIIKLNEKIDLILEIVKGIKTMKDSKVEKPAKKKSKKVAVKKTTKKKK